MSNYFGRIYQRANLTGLVAGSMTRSGAIGYVAAFPIPEVIRGINAFTLGVRAVNPKAEVRVVWTKSWYDPVMEKKRRQAPHQRGRGRHRAASGLQRAPRSGTGNGCLFYRLQYRYDPFCTTGSHDVRHMVVGALL